MAHPALHRRLVLAIAFATLAGTAVAGELDEAVTRSVRRAQGEALARAHCSVCHAIGRSDESPTWANRNSAFRRLFERFPIPMLEEAARTGRISGHDEMPGFDFTAEEIAALLTYIDSLAPDQPGYVERLRR